MHSCTPLFPLLALLAIAGLAQETPPEEARFTSRDAHQGVTIAARPLAETAAAEEFFGKESAPVRGGLLAVEILVVNNRAGEIALNVDRIALLRNGDKFVQLRPEEAALMMYPLPEGDPPKMGPRPLPLPRRPGGPRDKKRAEREEAEASLASRRFRTRFIPPGGRARGFLYFSLGEVETDLAGMQLYVPEVDDTGTGEGLLFFEIALAPADKP